MPIVPITLVVDVILLVSAMVQQRLDKINQCFLEFGIDPLENIGRLTSLAGSLLGATCALYNRLEGDKLITTAQWQTPPDFNPVDAAEGHICFDVIKKGSTDVVYLPNLPQTQYAHTDPNVRCYNLQTYLGRAVQRGPQTVGTLCVVFDKPFTPNEDDHHLLGLLASAVSVEEERWHVLDELAIYQHNLEQLVEARTVDLAAAHQQLQQQEKNYRTLFNAAPIAILVAQDGNYVFANPASLRLLGFRQPEEVIGRPIMQTIAPASREIVSERLQRVANNQANPPLELELLHPDGTIHLVESISVPVEFEGRPAALTFSRDLNVQRQAEELMRKHASVVQQTGDSVIITDKNGVIEYVNPAFEALTGYRSAEVVGQTPRILKSSQHPPPFYTQLWDQILAGQTFRDVLVSKKKNGELFYEEKTITPLRDAAGNITHFVSTGKDITERRLIEQERREREQFLASLSDITRAALDAPDLRTMLDILVKKLRALYNADSCYFILWDEGGQVPVPIAADGATPENQRKFFSVEIRPGEQTLSAALFEAGRPLVIENSKTSPIVHKAIVEKFDRRWLMGIPFMAGQQKLGAAIIIFNSPHQFSSTEITQAEQIGQQIALALAKVQLLEETQRRWREADILRQVTAAVTESLSFNERLVRILEQLEQVVPYDSASVQLLHNDYLEIISGRGFKEPEKIVGLRFSIKENNINARAAREKQPIVISDVWDGHQSYFSPPHDSIRSWLGVPLMVRERMIGMLTIDSFQPGFFNKDHIRLVVPFANQVAVSIENSRLYEQARRDAETKAVLLREVNHRVKNNLSAIIGLLYAERRHNGVKDDVVYQNIMQDLINRVKGLSVVHHLLSAAEWTPLPLDKITQKLIDAALHSLPPGTKVTVNVRPSPVVVVPKQANNLALVINELATNSLKYALVQRNTIRISVNIDQHGPLIRLEYRDNGPGFPPAILDNQQQNVGLYLVETLIRDGLLGTFSMYNDNGAVTVIEFSEQLHEAKQ